MDLAPIERRVYADARKAGLCVGLPALWFRVLASAIQAAKRDIFDLDEVIRYP